jgi:F-type H+-transporting ATPase subunit b
MSFNFGVFALQLISFLLSMWIASKLFLPYLKQWMADRKKRIENQIQQAEEQQHQAEVLKSKFEQQLSELQEKVEMTLRETRKQADQEKEKIIKASREEANRILTETRILIEQQKKEMTKKIQQEVGGMALTIAEKLIRASIDSKIQEALVQKEISEMSSHSN